MREKAGRGQRMEGAPGGLEEADLRREVMVAGWDGGAVEEVGRGARSWRSPTGRAPRLCWWPNRGQKTGIYTTCE